MRDLQGGDIDVLLEFVNTAVGHVKSGRARAIAVTGLERGRGEFPDLPTVAEVVPNFDMLGWHGILAPKGTPLETIASINAAFNKALDSREVKEKLAAGGLQAVGGSPEVFAARLQKEALEYSRIAEFAQIKPH
jgi:tripartite-type tricarboxylate transporter receptor subunit TctC